MLDEIQSLCRRAFILPLSAPLLVLLGLGLGRATVSAVALPDSAAVRHGADYDVPTAHLEALSRHMARLRNAGETTEEYVVLYRDHVAPVERTLRRRGVPEATARRVAWPLVEHAYRNGLGPATGG
jgi:hypothetical protein